MTCLRTLNTISRQITYTRCQFKRLKFFSDDMNVSQTIKTVKFKNYSTMEKDIQLRTLVVGMGNHSSVYTYSRHNVGMTLVNRMAKEMQLSWKRDKECQGDVAIATIEENHQLILLKPRLFVNVNGQSVSKTAEKFQLSAKDIYLIHDDLDLVLGKYTIKHAGSARGHNGVRSVMNSLRSDAMVRLRIGIGRPARREEVVDYVLSKFTQEEQIVMDSTMNCTINLLLQNIRSRRTKNEKKSSKAS
ncbi:putative peptidyl-tRNA hydrolase [Glandiceps talaboti]